MTLHVTKLFSQFAYLMDKNPSVTWDDCFEIFIAVGYEAPRDIFDKRMHNEIFEFKHGGKR